MGNYVHNTNIVDALYCRYEMAFIIIFSMPKYLFIFIKIFEHLDSIIAYLSIRLFVNNWQ